MHHFIYPEKDTYISSRPGYANKNFGIDEILQVGTSNVAVRSLNTTKTYSYTNYIFNSYTVEYFTGIFTGSLRGSVVDSYGTISGSGLVLSASYFSGSLDGGVVTEYSGGLSGSLNGTLSSSFNSDTWIEIFTGILTGSVGCLYGTASGTDTRNQQNWTSDNAKYIDRSLIKFDLTAISASISSGDILNPKFNLKLKVCSEYELPITYTIYALPISQSWNMGDGYFSDGGSSDGANWQYKDFNNGTQWWNTYTASLHLPIDFISSPSLTTTVFKYGGGTWYQNNVASQQFSYESSDINMDVTDIVMSWISGSIPNEGFILLSSDELQSTGSGFTLQFFSKDTNTIYSPYLDAMWDGNGSTGQPDFLTGSISTGSVTITTVDAGMSMSIQSGSSFYIGGGINGTFSGSTYMILSSGDINYISMSGIVDGTGLTGNISGVKVVGNYDGFVTTDPVGVTGSCGNSFTANLVTASFTSGVFSGSTFTAYYTDDQKLENAHLTGSWNSDVLLGSSLNIPLPSGIDPFAYAYVSGPYIYGKALGTYVISGSDSASFAGQFVEGPFRGGYLTAQLSGSIVTASYSYTSSVSFVSTVLTAITSSNPYVVVIQDVRPMYKAGDIVKIGVFARKQFPLKQFGISTQQEQYIIPEYLPTSSYYAIKDHETGEIVLGFDSYTRLSCEYPDGNYFVVDTTGFPQERYYRILIKVEDDGKIQTIDTGKTFKITR